MTDERGNYPSEEDEDDNSEQEIDDEADRDYGQHDHDPLAPADQREGGGAEMGIEMDSEERHQEDILSPCPIRDHAISILLQFGHFSLGEDFIDGTASSTLLIYFAAVRGLSSTMISFFTLISIHLFWQG
jgi:hypothetical protein